MQAKKMSQSIVIFVAVSDLLEAGINPEGIIETFVYDGKIIIQNADILGDFVCSGDCENCPMNETECDDDCGNCPCYDQCDESEVE